LVQMILSEDLKAWSVVAAHSKLTAVPATMSRGPLVASRIRVRSHTTSTPTWDLGQRKHLLSQSL
jgi:hypothetical protein